MGITTALGNDHACARLADGTVQCWGDNYSGEVGNGMTGVRPTPSTVLW